MSKAITILSTKKLKAELVQQSLEDGLAIQEHDFIAIQHILYPMEIPAGTLVFTSEHAVKVFEKNNNGQFYKAYCLQGATMSALTGIPSIAIQGSAMNAQLLAELIVQNGNNDPIVFICGDQRRNELPEHLRANGIKVQEIVAYKTIQTGQLINTNYEVVLFFSPSGVDSFFQHNTLSPAIICACIGETTATAVRTYSNNKIWIAPVPTQQSLLTTVKDFFNIISRKNDLNKQSA